MEESLKKQHTETKWYVNYEPIREFLNRELAKKPIYKDQDNLNEKISWHRDLKRPTHSR